MLERVRNAIVAPQKLIKYRNDRMLYIIFYMLLFAVLMTTGPVIRTYQSIRMTPTIEATITENFQFPSEACAIDNAVLNCDDEGSHVVYEEALLGLPFTVVLDGTNTYDKDNYQGNHIVFINDMVYISLDQYFIDATVYAEPIETMHPDFQNLSFNPQSDAEKEAFFEIIYATVSDELGIFRAMISFSRFVVELFSSMLLITVFVLLNSFLLQRQMSKVPFKQMFSMIAYASTLAYIVLVFYNLLLFNIFIFLVLLFVAFRQTSKLAFEIQKRLYKS